jgi:hypothetical protein
VNFRWSRQRAALAVVVAIAAGLALVGAMNESIVAIVLGLVLLQLASLALIAYASRRTGRLTSDLRRDTSRAREADAVRLSRALRGIEASLDAVRRESIAGRRALEKETTERLREREHQWLLLNERVEALLRELASAPSRSQPNALEQGSERH